MTVIPSDDYNPVSLQKQLACGAFGQTLHYFESIDSTNSFLRRLPADAAKHGTVVLTDHQAAGRGKYNRVWSDQPGRSLIFSFLLVPGKSPAAASWPLITLGAAVSVCRTLGNAGIADAQIRWPNDVLIAGKKVCGILTENGPTPSSLVVGIGLNVHQSSDEFPANLRKIAISLRMADERSWNRAELLVAILDDFSRIFTQWENEESDKILAECRRRMVTLGQSLRLTGSGRKAEGVVMDLDRDGSLVVRETTGIVSRWSSAEIVSL